MHPSDGHEPLLAGRYRLVALLGRGGMAEVYDGYDERLARPVAIKVLRHDLGDDTNREVRFRREARSAARLSHPSVVAVYDSGVDQGRSFLVMERLPGETLADRMRAGPIDQRWLATVAYDIVGALGAAHRIGLVHRDIKPANVLLDEEGRAKLADFGIAKTYRDDRATDPTGDLTATGLVLGTVAYLSPEQVQGDDASPRSDIYSLGVVLYEALAGQKPYVGANPVAQAHAAIEGRPTDLAALRPDVDPRFAAVIRRAMARNAADRYDSAAAMQAALGDTGLVASAHEMGRGGDPGATVVMPAAVAPTTLSPSSATPATTVVGAATTAVATGPPGGTDDNDDEAGRPGRRRGWLIAAATLAALIVIAVIAILLLDHHSPTSTPTTSVPAAAATTTSTVPASTTTAPTATTLDSLAQALLREADALSGTGDPGPISVATGLRGVAGTAPGSSRAAAATSVLQQAADLYEAGSITDDQYTTVHSLLDQAGASAPTTTTTTAPTTTTTTTPTTTTTTTPATTTTTAGTTKGATGG
jgi:serine/threonine-protein kinase